MDRFRAGSTLMNNADILRPEDWCGDMTVFKVRQKGYSKHKRKDESEAPLFIPVGMDVIAVENKITCVGNHVELPDLPEDLKHPVNGVPPYFIVNVMLPRYEPDLNLFSKNKVDGPNFSVIIYLLMTPETRASLQNLSEAPPAVRLLKRFIEDDSPAIRDRFKFMANTLNSEDVDMGMVVRKLVVDYNMKPVLSRPQHSFHTDNKLYFEVDVDVNIFGYLPCKTFATLRPVVDKLVLDVGFTIEGREDDELPETMLAVVHIDSLALDNVAKPFEQHIEEDARATRNEREKHARWSRRTTHNE
eukprot:m.281997 g.281997  ORF g.281997 m.281997 type:complete len:302 (-) comp16336_c0_seq24:1067-1972(-)